MVKTRPDAGTGYVEAMSEAQRKPVKTGSLSGAEIPVGALVVVVVVDIVVIVAKEGDWICRRERRR